MKALILQERGYKFTEDIWQILLRAALAAVGPVVSAALFHYLCEAFPNPNQLEDAVTLCASIAAGRIDAVLDFRGRVVFVEPYDGRIDA